MAAKIHIYLIKAKLKEVSLVFLSIRKKIFNGNLTVYFHNVLCVAVAEKFWKFQSCLPPRNYFVLCN